jgi:hypothetical protein
MVDDQSHIAVSAPEQSPGPSRVFLVGCPRSGTTLLQALLGAHKDIASFPESHIFTQGRLARLVPGWIARRNLERFARAVEAGSIYTRRRFALRPQEYRLDLFCILDKLTLERQKRLWVEKTPEHVLFIPEIRALAPHSKFIHIIRDGRAVVASLFEVTRTHADVWGRPWRGPMSLERCIDAWNSSVTASSIAMDTGSDGIVVNYERLTTDPALELQRLCEFLALSYEPQMLTAYTTVTSSIVNSDEEWKGRVSNRIHDNGLQKYRQLFSQEQQELIERSLVPLPASLWCR